MRAAAALRPADWAALALIVVVTFFSRFIPAYYVGVEVADLSMYRQMALAVQRGQDIYDVPQLFHYTPLSLFVPSFSLRVADALHQPFHLVIKILPMLSDVGIAVLMFLFVRQRQNLKQGVLAGLAYAVNPVSIIITACHGQFMPVSVFFAFWAYYLMEARDRTRTYILAALALGIGIALRQWPLLMLPFLLRRGMLNWRQRFVFVFIAALPSVLTLGPYLPFNFPGINREVFSYQSTTDFGWMGIWRCIWYLQTGNVHLPGDPTGYLSRSRMYFWIAYAVLVAISLVRPYIADVATWISSALLLTYTLVGGLASQYFGWVVPFLILRPAYSTVFTLLAASAMITFYLTWFPSILVGTHSVPFQYTRPQIVTWNLVFLTATWLAGAIWLLRLLWWTVRPGTTQVAAAIPADTGTPDGHAAISADATGPASRRWITAGYIVLGGWVLGTLAVEIPYIIETRPAPALPVTIKWVAGSTGSKPGQVDAPIALLAHPSGDIYVADLGNSRVQRFNSGGEFVDLWRDGVEGSPGLMQPSDLVVGSHGEVYVLDAGVGGIFRLEDDGHVRQLFSLGPLQAFTPRGLALDEARGRFYVTDTGHGGLLVVGLGGKLIARWGGDGTPLNLALGWALGLDKQSNLLVLERGSSRIRKLSPEGKLLKEWRIKGEASDLAVGPDDRVYVTASDRSSLWVFDTDGNAIGEARVPNQPQARGVAVIAPGDVVMGTEASIVRFLLQFGQ